MLRLASTASACLLLLACTDAGGDSQTSASAGGSSSTSASSGPGASSDPSASSGGASAGSTSTTGSATTGSGGEAGTTDDDTGTASGETGGGETTGGGTTGDTDGASSSTGDDGSSSSTGDTPLSDDPFDPAACNGVAWTSEDALARLGGMPREVLTGATIQVRTRDCAGDVCGDWGPNADWIISYLTWSGGVVTAYTDLEAAMNLVLFDDDGTPRLSMQHETFGVGGYPDDDGVLYGFPPQVVNYPHLRAYNEFPENEYYYIDLDYQVAQGEMVLGEGCAVWTANPYGTGQPYTAQYGAVFHW